jgi:hypothetical protein
MHIDDSYRPQKLLASSTSLRRVDPVDTFKDRTSGLGAAQRKKQAGGPAIVRQASFEDYEQISALQIRNGLTTTCYEVWKALWIDNPAYHEWKADWPIGWVVQAGTGEVVGFVGNIPSLVRRIHG